MLGSQSERESERFKWTSQDKVVSLTKDKIFTKEIKPTLNYKKSLDHNFSRKGSHCSHEEYDMLKMPADWTKAELHAKSRETKPELDGDEDG